ncbi:hypothetical protein [Streptomyces sp. NPDC101150]|uniref:hypothetical protein n=1 Tax=Streptomyces sp. NPDC101150 TaxID=3366114 RepID=UPI0038245B16
MKDEFPAAVDEAASHPARPLLSLQVEHGTLQLKAPKGATIQPHITVVNEDGTAVATYTAGPALFEEGTEVHGEGCGVEFGDV